MKQYEAVINEAGKRTGRIGRRPFRIAVLGAECSGKTTLVRLLADKLSARCLPETLRQFCQQHQRTPRPDEQQALLEDQILQEQQVLSALIAAKGLGHRAAPLIVDSTPLATALYSLDLFGDASLLEAGVAHQRSYDLTLLAGIDLPWEPDGFMRDGPVVRARFDALLRETLESHGLAYVPLQGALSKRLIVAMDAIGKLET
jgi:nicotinamide riboside kinase